MNPFKSGTALHAQQERIDRLREREAALVDALRLASTLVPRKQRAEMSKLLDLVDLTRDRS